MKDCFLIGETTVTYTPTFWTSTSQGFLSNSACLLTFKLSHLPLAATNNNIITWIRLSFTNFNSFKNEKRLQMFSLCNM